MQEYVDFFIGSGKRERDINEDLVSVKSFDNFQYYLQVREQKEKAYKNFMKSINNIAQDCLELKLHSSKDYIRYLIANRKLASYFLTGKLSAYWLAAIPKFQKIVACLD